MKKFSTLLVIFAFILLFTYKAFSQSVWFVNPTNGLDVTNLYSETQISLNFQYNWQRSSNPNLITYYIKLFADPVGTYQSNQGNGIPQWFYLTPGTYQWRLELWEGDGIQGSVKTAEQTISFNVKHTFNVKNNFGYGIINVDYVQKNSPFQLKKFIGDLVTGGAIDQVFNNTSYVWNQSGINNSDWGRGKIRGTYIGGLNQSRDYTYTLVSDDNGASLIANLRKICSVNFQNSFVGIGNSGVINVNGSQYNSPTSYFPVVELNPITALPASGQIINGIVYNFSKWSDGNTTANRTFNPSANATYTAQYIGKPSTYDPNTGWSLNLHHSTTVDEPIVLYWNEHPNTYVTKYQIWKKEKYNGVTSDSVLMATVNRGTTSYVDNDFVYSLLKNKYWIYYTIVPYYSLENTYGLTSWMPVTAEALPKTSDSTFAVTSTVLENSLSNFPNPFNPSTNINFSIKDAGFVSIRVFDLIGQQVAELVNEEKPAGSYSVKFDASKLPSGIYIYTINSGTFNQTRKMLLMK